MDQSLAFSCKLSVTPQGRGSGASTGLDVGRLWGMRQVSDSFLLNMAEVSGALVGLFLVGIFFFLEASGGRLDKSREVLEPYLRASTRIVLVLLRSPYCSRSPLWSWSRSGTSCSSPC